MKQTSFSNRITRREFARRSAACAAGLAGLAKGVARAATRDPICPELVPCGDTLALTLPGDPQHSVRDRRIAGTTRYVLRDAHWRAEDAR